jgi:hypothetical protein
MVYETMKLLYFNIILNKLDGSCAQSRLHAEKRKMINPMAISITTKNHSFLKKVMICFFRGFIIYVIPGHDYPTIRPF